MAVLGSYFTAQGMNGWYESLVLPALTPSGSVISAAWTVIFVLFATSLLTLWNLPGRGASLENVLVLAVIVGVATVSWSYFFFVKHQIGAALFTAVVIEISVLLLIGSVWRYSTAAGALLLPYAGWVAFAIYLNYLILALN